MLHHRPMRSGFNVGSRAAFAWSVAPIADAIRRSAATRSGRRSRISDGHTGGRWRRNAGQRVANVQFRTWIPAPAAIPTRAMHLAYPPVLPPIALSPPPDQSGRVQYPDRTPDHCRTAPSQFGWFSLSVSTIPDAIASCSCASIAMKYARATPAASECCV